MATNQRTLGTLTHTLTWGYWLRDGTYIQLLKLSFNASVIGYDTNAVAVECGEFLAYTAMKLPVVVDGQGNLIQHKNLTSRKLDVCVGWLVLLFVPYLWLTRGDRLTPL